MYFHITVNASGGSSNKRTKKNYVIHAKIKPEPANMFEANAKLPIGRLHVNDYGLGINMLAIFPKN